MQQKTSPIGRINPVAKYLKTGKMSGAGRHGPSDKAKRQRDRLALRKEWT